MVEVVKDTKNIVLECRNVAKIFDSNVVAIQDFSFSVEKGEVFAIIGPSGCGKSTIIKMLAGLESPSSGVCLLNAREINGTSPECCLIYQEPSLFPWLSVRKNVEFPLVIRGVKRDERKQLANKILEQVGLSEFTDVYPSQLSGGMQQRVAIARALVIKPRVLLMDEPFGALDAQTRFLMQQFLLDLWKITHKTIVLVTHQIDEAILLASNVLVVTSRPGRCKELIPVHHDYHKDPFSKEFFKTREYIFKLLQEEVCLGVRNEE